MKVHVHRAWTIHTYLLTRCLAVPRLKIGHEWFRLFYYTMIHIGKLIEEELYRQEHSITWFAKKLYCDRTNIYSIFKRESINTELLLRISQILHHNFFSYYINELSECEKNSTIAWFLFTYHSPILIPTFFTFATVRFNEIMTYPFWGVSLCHLYKPPLRETRHNYYFIWKKFF